MEIISMFNCKINVKPMSLSLVYLVSGTELADPAA